MKYFSEKLNALFDTEAELLKAEREADNKAKANELYDDINDILGFACAYMTFAMQKVSASLALVFEIENTYGVKYEFNRGLIGGIAEKYIKEMCDCMEEDDAYAKQCLEAWDNAWNGSNDSCICCGESDCDCEECKANTSEFCVARTPASEHRPFYSINIRNPIFQNFIHEYRNIAPLKELAEEFPSIAEMLDRLESGND